MKYGLPEQISHLALSAYHFNQFNFKITTHLSDFRHVFTFRAALSMTTPLADTPRSLERNIKQNQFSQSIQNSIVGHFYVNINGNIYYIHIHNSGRNSNEYSLALFLGRGWMWCGNIDKCTNASPSTEMPVVVSGTCSASKRAYTIVPSSPYRVTFI